MWAATSESFGLRVNEIPGNLKTQKNNKEYWNALTIWAPQLHSLLPTHGTFHISLSSVAKCCTDRFEFTFFVHDVDVARGPSCWDSYVLNLLSQIMLTDPVKFVYLICVNVSFKLDIP